MTRSRLKVPAARASSIVAAAVSRSFRAAELEYIRATTAGTVDRTITRDRSIVSVCDILNTIAGGYGESSVCLSCGERQERNEGADSELVSSTATASLRETLHCDRIVGREKAMVRSRIFPASARSEEGPLCSFLVLSPSLSLSLTHTHALLDLDLLGSAVEIERTLEWLG